MHDANSWIIWSWCLFKSVCIARTKGLRTTLHVFPCLFSFPSITIAYSHSPPEPSFYHAALRQIRFHWTASETLSYCTCTAVVIKTFLPPLWWAESMRTLQPVFENISRDVKGDNPQHTDFFLTTLTNLFIYADSAGKNFLWMQPKKLNG